ncbi:uncharacterized protein [Littorina saxatilis]|uniref:uncharacterized protein n=1 Tax=Littorina saxatilis TaxID=31220 RepID=UPI0038B673A3
MRCGSVVVVLLVASFVSQSEAGWGSVFNKIKEGVNKATDWVKDNCSVNLTGPDCTIVSGKRGVGNQGNAMDGACDAIGDNPALLMGLSFDVVKDVFEAIDDGDDVLDGQEFVALLGNLRK